MSWKPTKTIPLPKLIGAVNICELLLPDDLATIGNRVAEGYEQDIQSRTDWERRQANANKLVLQVVESRTDPWPNASNIKFPLVTVAAMQFQARAYPGLISGTDLVKCRVIGQDEKGDKRDRAERIANHMSWQCLEQDPSWEEDHDKLCLVTAIAGCGFVKSGFEPGPGRLQSQLVLPRHFVINYWTRSIEDSPRYTHTFYLNANNIRQREIDGRFRELPQSEDVSSADGSAPVKPDPTAGEDEIGTAKDLRQGLTRPEQDDVTPWFTGEQYCWLDLDGDGYEEPYIVTFDIGSGVVRRIVARYLASGVKFKDGQTLTKFARTVPEDGYEIPADAEVYKVSAVRVFTKYGFIPSPDGGFYDLGLGSLEGPINVSVNTIINMMVDAGTMKTLGGGFLGRGFKGKGGPITFAPGQWYPLDAPGDDIRKSMLPRPDPDPPPFLFQLLGLLIQYAERIVSANDIQSGEQEMQNQKAETTRILNENGSRVYNGIFKRFWRSLRDEYRVRYELNALFLQADVDFEDLTTGRSAIIRPDDYLGSSLDVRPAADPHIVSDAEAQKQALTLVQLSQSSPGFNRYRSMLRLLKAQKVPNIEEVYPPPQVPDPKTGQMQPAPDHPPPPNPKLLEVQVKQAKVEVDKASQQLKEKEFQAEQVQSKIDTLLHAQEVQAHIAEMIANAEKLKAEAKGAEAEPVIKMLYAQIESEGKYRDHLLQAAEMIDKKMERMNGSGTGTNDGNKSQPGVAGGAQQPGAAALPPPNGGIPQAGMGTMGL